jgi:hypothetical protein
MRGRLQSRHQIRPGGYLVRPQNSGSPLRVSLDRGGEARPDRSLERILEAIAGEATSHSSPHSSLLCYQEADLGMERCAWKHGGKNNN